jgi:hypothetical protein
MRFVSLVLRTDDPDLELLKQYAVGGDFGRGPRAGDQVEVVVTGCAYSCCGGGWRRRDGYEQTYRGHVDNLRGPTTDGAVGSFMLYSHGVGTLSYVVAVTLPDLALVEALH